MHPLLTHQLEHYLGTAFVVPDGEMCSLFEAISAHYEKLEYSARFDPMTDVANRRYFVEMVEVEMIRSLRYGKTLSILMVDVDRFKEVNDMYGHQAGDIVLQSLCETFKVVLRSLDVVGRWGGDEFAVLLPQTQAAMALQVAERLRGAIEQTAINLHNHPPFHFSVSIGCISWDARDDDLEAILAWADEALYYAKRGGRNRVCVADR